MTEWENKVFSSCLSQFRIIIFIFTVKTSETAAQNISLMRLIRLYIGWDKNN